MLDRRAGRSDSSAMAHPETLFSCPMHPEVVSSEAGRCPECGMDLEERPGSPEELAKLYGEAAVPHEHGDAMSDAVPAGQYSCSMHPEIVSDEAGRCPVCGMFLDKVATASEEQP